MKAQDRKGFTLIELLVVMTIIAVLAGLLLPAIGDVRRRASTLKCLSHMRSIGTAMSAWVIGSGYEPVMPAVPAEASSYFQSHTWDDHIHNYSYCWSTDGSDGPAKARTIITNLYPTYLKVGKVFYCPSFNRMTKQDLGGAETEVVTYSNSWLKDETDWWGYEWVNPRWPVTDAWVSARYPIGSITRKPTPNAVMFCHYSVDHASVLYSDGSVEGGRKWLQPNNVPYGW